MEHAKDSVDNLLAEREADDGEAGELLPEARLSEKDSPYRLGQEVLVRVRVPGYLKTRRGEMLGHAMGRVVAILPGLRLAYIVKIYEGKLPWPPLIVNPEDLAEPRFQIGDECWFQFPASVRQHGEPFEKARMTGRVLKIHAGLGGLWYEVQATGDDLSESLIDNPAFLLPERDLARLG